MAHGEAHDGQARPKELGAFLRAHRHLLTPEGVGLPGTARRRTPGLRREEVAALSGVGVAWYTWLEQGRVVPSKKVLDAVARTLRLDSASHRHLLSLAGMVVPAAPAVPDRRELAVTMQPVLDGWATTPAVLLDRRFDIIAWNDAYAAVWGDPALIPAERRNLMWCVIGHRPVRDALVDWEPVARAILAQFRAQTARTGDDRRTVELYRLLHEDFPQLAGWWECQGVDDLTVRDVDVRLPDGEPATLRYSAMRPVDNTEALLVLQTPVEARGRRRIAVLTSGLDRAPQPSLR